VHSPALAFGASVRQVQVSQKPLGSLRLRETPRVLGAFGVLSLYEPVHVHQITTNVPFALYGYEYYWCWYYHEPGGRTLGARIPLRYGCVKLTVQSGLLFTLRSRSGSGSPRALIFPLLVMNAQRNFIIKRRSKIVERF